MGNTVSAGENNEELICNLVAADYIKTARVERVFRAVDRGHFFPDDATVADTPYRDVAWKSGHIHISAPCIYSEVMENIDLRPGLSFLNLGSGTGYLSTIAGLLLGGYGVNHGVEMYEDVVEFATQRVKLFTSRCSALDEFEFCAPKFFCGNGLLLPAGTQYDRVYCGAACCEERDINYLRGLVKENGILIAPVHSELLMFERISETQWTTKLLLPVAFATLLPATNPFLRVPAIPSTDAMKLEDICCLSIRAILRKKVEMENPELTQTRISEKSRMPKKRKARNDDSDSDSGLDGEETYFACVSHRVKLDSGVVEDIDDDLDIKSESDSEPSTSQTESEISVPTFSELMRAKIKCLELPKPLLQYLNLGNAL